MGKYNLNALDSLRRARIHVQKHSVFFGILSRHLKFIEIAEDFMEMGAGVDAQGNFYYKKSFVESLSDEELQGLVIHETEHCAFAHIPRLGNRNRELWNVSTDIIVNNIAIRNGYKLPKGGLIPENNSIKINGKKYDNLDRLSAEELYEKLEHLIHKGGGGDGEGEGLPKGFDEHMKNGKPLTDEEKRQIEKEWVRRTREAIVLAKTKGNMPVGVELLVDKLQRSQIDWKTILLRNVQSVIPYDYTYSRCNKRSITTGFYSPDYLKERVEVLIAIDTSGSIGQTELTEFVSEMVGLAKGYQDRIEMRVLTHDIGVHDDYLLENGAAYKINQLKIHGGGGTSHEPVLEHIKTKYPRTKLAIFLTDGHSDLESLNLRAYPFRKIIILNKYGKDVKDLVLNDDTKLIKLK